jgi:hypothetical protein
LAAASACLFQALCLAHRVLVRLCLQERYLVCPEVCLLEAAWRVALLGRLVLVRLCPQEMCRVCLEVCLLEVAWLSALLQAFRLHQVHPMAGFPLRVRQHQWAEERSWDSLS